MASGKPGAVHNSLEAGVGGVPTGLHAVPDNHHYMSCSFNSNWKPIVPVWGTTVFEDEKDLQTGKWSFRYDIVRTDEPGVPVLAVEVPQAKIGFVYAPLLEDYPKSIQLLYDSRPYTQCQKEIHDAMRSALEAKVREHHQKLDRQ
jgi:hypothetical protein